MPTHVSAELALNVSPHTNTTRMSADTIQQASSRFRGIQDWTVIPFADATIDHYSTPLTGNIANLSRVQTTYNYLDDEAYDLQVGTSSFLCYGRAIVGDGTKFDHGSTVPYYDNYIPHNITFSPDPISPQATVTAEVISASEPLRTYLNNIANAKVTISGTDYYWRNSTEDHLSRLYQSFVNNSQVMAGSSASIRCLVNSLYNTLASVDFTSSSQDVQDLQTEILDKIKDGVTFTGGTDLGSSLVPISITSLGNNRENFPANKNLPDGAAAIKWNSTNNQFELQTTTSVSVLISSLTQFVYPAELWYYTKSRIKTSASLHSNTYTNSWSTVLSSYEYDNATVDLNTRSVAIKEPLNYGVGSIKAYLWATDPQLLDKESTQIPLQHVINAGQANEETVDNFTLTAVLLGGQYPQHYNFKPVTPADGQSEGITYDKTVGNVKLKYCAADPNDGPDEANREYFYTLSHQTLDDELVHIILEFEYNGEEKFMGHDGYIFPGMKFYLIGEIEPPTNTPVAEQDKQAKIGIRISSLAYAFNVIPDLSTITAVIKVVTLGVSDWKQAGVTDQHGLYNW